ncbi:MAG TPA: exodeoxyribonuclease VII large subunit [Phycisphaerales bacterium]|nr:exodeoxyribonuclease VII large subunit [Phycisphaerales bacterium]HMP36661.1 exodeoxyribonuclease VII large subunit [Phycisphaerales bacterium]
MSQASALIRQALEEGIPAPLRVVGELSGLAMRNHWYFSLKDEGAVLSCVAWASSAARFGFVPRDGEEVIATGHVSHYAPQGRTQFYVTRLAQLGAGALMQRFRAMCEELRALGWFEDARKRPLPALPRRIAVITSRGGAALQDVLDTARRRCRAVGLTIVDVRVQGEGAAAQVAAAIAGVNRHRAALGVDAILVTRGGGSIEDLWAFNERIVSEATVKSALPVVAAIGHESDTTVIELVADLRAATPTQAVMRLVPDAGELLRQVDHLGRRLALLLSHRLDRERRRLAALERHELLRSPGAAIARHRERADARARRLRSAARLRLAEGRRLIDALAAALERIRPAAALAKAQGRVEVAEARLGAAIRARVQLGALGLAGLDRQLRAVDPTRVLARGYSITAREDGTVLRRARDAEPGTRLVTELAEGRVHSVVTAESRA